ncbi:hypothetical protein RDV78_06425 [Bacillota bacterium LX-D]|nr:hypothetical protein [Bacillota bacterium LX-D]
MEVKAFVERIVEGAYALVKIGGSSHEVYWSKHYLPPNVQEGDTLKLTIEIDRTAGKKKHKVSYLADRFKK